MAFTPITVTRRYLTAEFTPAKGTVRFTPTAPMINGDTVIAASRVGTLDAEGDLTLVVAANNDPTTTPPGVSYEVREDIDGQPTRTYFVTIPYNAVAGTVALSTLNAAAAPPVVTYPAPGPPGPNKIATASDFVGTGAAVGSVVAVSTVAGSAPTGFNVLATETATAASVGLGSVDNTSDMGKPVSSAQQVALDTKAHALQIDVFTASGTWTKPTWAVKVTALLIAAGGGGGSGARRASATASSGGAGGGGGGWTIAVLRGADLSATEAVTVGVGGTAGTAVTANDTNGVAGGAGGNSEFGTSATAVRRAIASGGSGGAAGALANATAGGAGNGTAPGAAGRDGQLGAAGLGAFSAWQGAPGGGSGGGVSATPAAFSGGSGGTGQQAFLGGGGGGAAGVNGFVGTSTALPNEAFAGGGGGGGGSSITAAGGNGGSGGSYGGAGGGGGSSLNGFNSGAGGAGAPGVVIIISE